MKELWLYEPVFKQNYYFLRKASAKEINDFCKKNFSFNPEYEENGAAGKCCQIFNEKNEMRIVISVRSWVKSDPYCLSVFMHECNHAAMYTMEKCGVDVSVKNHEAFNYLAMYIFEEFLKMDKTKGK